MIILKFIASFFLGGILIGIQSILAEKCPKYGGYIISLPSTLPLSLFFIGWTNGMDDAIGANIAVPFSIINLIIFSFIFYFLLVKQNGKILLVNIFSILTWLMNSVIIQLTFSSVRLEYSLIGALLFIAIAFVFFRTNIKLSNTIYSKKNNNQAINLFQRIIIAGGVITSASLLSYFLSPFWGGIFAVFPAAYISSFNFIYFSKGIENIREVILRVPEGCLLFLIYSAAFWIIESSNIFIKISIAYLLTVLIGGLIIYSINKIKLNDV